jgi:hypothetical protein
LSFSDRIAACNDFDPGLYRPFRVDGIEVGRVRHGFIGPGHPEYQAIAGGLRQ